MEFRKKKYLCIGIFAVMCVYLLLQFHYVKVYFDDYGYYSLSYGVNSVKSGHNFNFTELISYLKIHYFDVNGRIPGYFVWLGMYIFGGLSAVQTIAAGFVLLILVLLWKFIDNQKFPALSALLVCAFYGLISLDMHRQGTYWFAAFFQYVAPLAGIVSFVSLYFKYRDGETNLFRQVMLVVLVVLSAYSQEQLSVTVTFMMGMLIVFELIQKKLNIWNFVYFVSAGVCVAALLLSPSAQDRAANAAYPFVERVIYSTYNTIRTFYAADISTLVILLHIALFSFSAKLFEKDNLFLKLIDIAALCLAVGTIFIYFCSPLRDVLAKFTFNRYYALIYLAVPCIALLAIQIMRYYWTESKFNKLLMFITAVGAIGCLCFVPETPERLFISGWVLLFPTLAEGVFVSAEFGVLQKHRERLLAVFCAIVVLLASYNGMTILKGYSQNAIAYDFNDKQISEAVTKINNGEQVDEIYLRTMPYPECAAALPYDWEVTYMRYWINSYYEIPAHVKFYYSEDGAAANDSGYEQLDLNIYLSK